MQLVPWCRKYMKVRAKLQKGYDIILIGHKNHPEVIGTMGQLPEKAISLVETVGDVKKKFK